MVNSPAMLAQLLNLLGQARVYDLGQPLYVGMPHYPTHPPFLYSLSKKHGDYMLPGEVSSAAEAIALGGHVGTHIDALCHFSRAGRLHGGIEIEQSHSAGIGALSIDTVTAVIRRGVMLDIAAAQGVESLDEDFVIAPEHLDAAAARQNTHVEAGDVVLLRTGWGRFWNDAARYISEVRGPGPELPGARWLAGRSIFAAGSDTIAFEKAPSSLPCHPYLLVDCGIHIIEALNLEHLAAAGVYEFAFVALPLKIAGGTGSPLRPVALSFTP
jgi:kynurenine formamidase